MVVGVDHRITQTVMVNLRTIASFASSPPWSWGEVPASADVDDLAGDVGRLAETRKATVLATSSGLPCRRSGVSAMNAS